MQEKNPKTSNTDIFLEAAMRTIETKTLTLKEERITERKSSAKKSANSWKGLKSAMDNEHAQRFNDILHNLPDREFARVYLKSLEFFKAKIVRQTGDKKPVNDTTINIQVNYAKDDQQKNIK